MAGEKKKMKNDMMLSVIVFTYNHQKYVEKCIDSILAQRTEFKYEIIVADDCSTDSTVELVKKKYGRQIKIICQGKNMGLCVNMYCAFKEAKGEYIYSCSGDDYLLTDQVFQKHIDLLEMEPDTFSVSNWILFFNENSNESRVQKTPYEQFALIDFLRGTRPRFYLGTIRNTFKTDDVEYLIRGSRNNEEIQMFYYSLSKGVKRIIPEALYVYCYRSSGADNYNSESSNLQTLGDYAKGFYAIEEVSKGQYNFGVAKITFYQDFVDRILLTKDIRQIFQITKVLKMKDILGFIGYKFVLKFNGYKMPNYFISEKRLIKGK